MSLWNFLGELALLKIIVSLFSSKSKVPATNYVPMHNRNIAHLNGCDTEKLQKRIDELESQLLDCDEDSDRYDLIQDQIDSLEDRLDDFEFEELMQDDFDNYIDTHHHQVLSDLYYTDPDNIDN